MRARFFITYFVNPIFTLFFFWFPIIFFVSLFFNHSPYSFYLKIKSSVWAFLPLIFLVFRSIYQVDYFYASFEAVFLLFFSHFPFVYGHFCRFCYVFRIALKKFYFCSDCVLYLFFSIILYTCSCFLIMQFVSSVFSHYYFYISLLINLFILI